MPHFELGKGKRTFFRIWVAVLIILFVIAILIVILKYA
jgi:hypothetical protein